MGIGTVAWAFAALTTEAPAATQQAQGAPAQAAAQAAAPAAARAGLEYLVGGWDVVATDPGDGTSERFSYRVAPLIGSAWIAGHGRSEDGSEEARDVWGFDLASGELMRIIFNRDGTHAIVRAPGGWQGDRLVLEGDARSAGGVVRVRETITRLGADEFVATWEAYRNGAWSAYSVERVTRREPAARS